MTNSYEAYMCLETFHDLSINQFGHHDNLELIHTYILIWILKERWKLSFWDDPNSILEIKLENPPIKDTIVVPSRGIRRNPIQGQQSRSVVLPVKLTFVPPKEWQWFSKKIQFGIQIV